MPEFAPSESKTARAPITVKPSGLSCSAELYLVSNGAKVDTSGIKPFTSTGAKQDISFPVTMPSAEGTYPIYLDVFVDGQLIGAYKAIEDVVIKALLVAGWQYDVSMEVPAWLWRRETWGIWREEYVTSSLGMYVPTPPYTEPIDLSDCSPEQWAPPYTEQEKAIGRSATLWGKNRLQYTVVTIVAARADLGGWQATYEQHYLGLDNADVREYWKTQIPTDVPIAFMFYRPSGMLSIFSELESVGAADITDVWVHARAPEWLQVRMIIYDFDSFVNIIRKCVWLNASAGLALC